MKYIIFSIVVSALASTLAFANNGIAYGADKAMDLSPIETVDYGLWVAGTDDGPVLQNFSYFNGGLNGNHLYFQADRVKSFNAYNDPFFGAVVDISMEGLYGGTNYGQGRRVNVRFRASHSSFPGSTFGYYAIDITLPGGTTSIFSRVGVTLNMLQILVSPDGTVQTNQAPSGHGVVYGDVVGQTNRGEPASVTYWVSDSYFQSFLYSDANGLFQGSRLRSFACTNDGLFGKQAELWMDGRSSGRSVVAHVILTKSYNSPAYNLMYVAEYLPTNLSTPIYERLVFVQYGGNGILCK